MEPSLTDAVLGTLVYDERTAWYQGRVTKEPVGSFNVVLSTESEGDVRDLIHQARDFVQGIAAIDR